MPASLSYAGFVEFGREAIGASIDSSAAVSAGVEAISHEIMQYGRTAFVTAGETARDLLGARTVEDIVRLQSDYAKRSFAGWVERCATLSQLGCSLFSVTIGTWAARTPR